MNHRRLRASAATGSGDGIECGRDRGCGRGAAEGSRATRCCSTPSSRSRYARPGAVSRAAARSRRLGRATAAWSASPRPRATASRRCWPSGPAPRIVAVAWVSLDRFDDDPAVLLTLLASAYARVSPGNADLVADMGGLGVSVLGRAAPRLASALRTSPVPFVLMLDDLHELRSPACHDVLSVVISGIPRGSQLVAASRCRAAAPAAAAGLGRRAGVRGERPGPRRGRRRADLLGGATSSLTRELAAAVTERTEGWPVGLYLAAVIAQRQRRRGARRSPVTTGTWPTTCTASR